ncbi:serine hydrolase domain-containing protein [Corynebacterium hansenii]|uniref:Serine hydrolase domain-containing protein n=1 Tax=Corynebacterium hansenii TaxID=394964 RepID=A0ABV7ZS02_9CORY|nr:serine hydrolase domain-containing protein [Corynebacterium hansenii]WJZ00582.1 D-alanyl-D-alanine carboxypeptidase precursor [Corynebacterium hansenii]
MEARSPAKPSASTLIVLILLAVARIHVADPAHVSHAVPVAQAAHSADIAHAADGDSRFAAEATELGVPGGAVARIKDGVARTETFGHDGDGEPIDDTTPMLWGSVSKPVAAAVVKRLAEEKALDLDAPASRYVDGAPDVPVRSLLDHTAGLGFGAELLDVDRPGATATEVVADAAGEIAAADGERGAHRYSSLGYLVLQAVVESAAGGTYQDAVRATPGAAGVGASAGECAGVPRGHRFAGPFAWPMDTGYDGAGPAYGYSCGGIDDLAEFAVSQLDAAEEIAAKQADAQPTSQPRQRYGPGWRITEESDGRTTVWHTGTVPGYFSAVYLDPSRRDGVAVLLNASGYLSEEQLAGLTRLAFDEVTGATSRDSGASDFGAGRLAVIVPAALLGLALAVLVAGWFARRTVRPVVWAVIAVSVTTVAVVGAPLLMGVPPPYFWLWEPGAVIAAAAVPAAMLAAAVMSRRAPNRW